MTNPVAQIVHLYWKPKNEDGSYPEESVLALTQVQVWCVPCNLGHRFTVEVHNGYNSRAEKGEQEPLWTWNRSLESPTFAPSLRAGWTVHLCSPEYVHYEVCPDYEACEQKGHSLCRLVGGVPRMFKTYEKPPRGAKKVYCHWLPHQVEPGYGDCHTMLQAGVWNYLDDCAHNTRGLHPLEPLPDRLVKDPWPG